MKRITTLMITAVFFMNPNGANATEFVRYHSLVKTKHEYIIEKRCVDSTQIFEDSLAHVKETYDEHNRTIKLEFFDTKQEHISVSFELAPIIVYIWDGNQVEERKLNADMTPWSGEFARKNRRVWERRKKRCVISDDYKDDEWISGNLHEGKFELNAEVIWFLRYAGCEVQKTKSYNF